MMHVNYFALATVIFIGSFAHAGELTGVLAFAKKPPFAGALYAKMPGAGTNTATLDQVNKIFSKKVFAIANGGTIQFKNSDTFQHNIFADDPSSGVQFDLGLMEVGTETRLEVTWRENTLTRIGCKIHPKMRSYVLNAQSEAVQLFEFDKKVKEYPISLQVADEVTSFALLLPKYDPVEFNLLAGEAKTIEVTRKGKVKGTLTVKR